MVVFDVANYILDNLGEMTTMKLQKLVYYSQAYSLAWDGAPLFEEDFEAWANGPVCKELFTAHQSLFTVDETFFKDRITETVFSCDQKKTIGAVLDAYGDKTPLWLSELSHEERPWLEARKGVAPGMPSDKIISKEIMQEYYGAPQV